MDPYEERFNGEKLILSDREWEQRLTSEQYHVLRHQGTEKAFANAYYDNKQMGIYVCAGCSLPLFSSEAKYDSGTGWPSFWQPLFPENVYYREDRHLLYLRTEVICSRCDGHLGHVFPDGPPPTHQRYCMNSLSLRFINRKA